MTINQLSEKLLLQVKKHEPTTELLKELEHFSFAELRSSLKDDHRKKAFWINIYNTFFQIIRKEKQLGKPEIYRHKLITIAGQSFSLDDIEHGILRRARIKWSLGYVSNPFASSLLKKLMVSKVDYRIHFALNCGAKSCPPIAFYSPEKIEAQLQLATVSFLEAETDIFPDQKEIHVTRLFLWFLGDFGGYSGIRRILKEYLELEPKGMKLVYKKYDWDEVLDNFS